MELKTTKQTTGHKLSVAGILITMGVVYGDIGTSPLYVMKSIVEGNGGLANISRDFITGSISLVFWTLMLMTTIKYVMIALRADNNGEGGIFALYTLIRKQAKWLVIPAIIGGATLLADGMLTPAVTVTTAIEGLKGLPINGNVLIHNQNQVILVTVSILSVLFFIQKFGTDLIGKSFGPIMLIWFTFIGGIGLVNLMGDLTMLKALNPYYAIELLFSPENKVGILILGSVFLATTGAEALYSDMGHVGRLNIYGSWPYIALCLVLNYFGQGVWLLQHKDVIAYQRISDFNPFFEVMPAQLKVPAILLATIAAIIASQALISGSYTLVSEAIKLRLLPRIKVDYPAKLKGQLYISIVNWILWAVCLMVVFYFKNSAHMEAAYGLAITITMLMTTILLFHYLGRHEKKWGLAYLVLIFFGTIEVIFFISSAAKFMHGGYVTVLIAAVILSIMFVWYRSNTIKESNTFKASTVSLLAYKQQLHDLRDDTTLAMYTTNLVYLSKPQNKPHEQNMVKKNILYSILDKRPKRAQVYWFVAVNVTDEPYTAEYTADTLGTDYIVNVQLYLGFKMEQKVNIFIRQIIQEMIHRGELPAQPQRYTTIPNRNVGDFSFVIMQEDLSPATQIRAMDKGIVQMRLWLEKFTDTPASWFGLDYSDVFVERIPLVLGRQKAVSKYHLKRRE
ncbi:potassium transporter Kup [Lactobacillus curvatus]|uniref:KUP/HAK/KT family potassium transporter n=1 Tax=Latilactobacillus fragifolii TaxID=2814244 RepID=UPI0012AF33EE|nr:KUP/HAK/KT family potassium transporter [Latilactobacillus fragifolii]MSD82923.1 potassium transporter Kup [Latilactobacillus curvatus]MSE23020.1 potassium transporter Kup [Latilactobacillus curvatus]